MKYGIKLKNNHGEYAWYKLFTEEFDAPTRKIEFNSEEDAHDFADRHEFPNTYIVEKINE